MKIREVAFLPLETMLIYVLIVVGGIVASLIVIYAMRRSGKDEADASEGEKKEEMLRGFPFRIAKTVHRTEAGQAENELRLLDLEREILSHAIRRLYEAHAEGKITEEERERIADIYKSRMMNVKDAMEKDQSLVALHELENMQEDLLKLFSDRFDELSGKINELRTKVKGEPIEEIKIIPTKEEAKPEKTEKTSKKPPREKEKKEKKKRTKPAKTEAEKRIEQIRDEVEKVLDRLGQMEIET
jgi:hypothetical protein